MPAYGQQQGIVQQLKGTQRDIPGHCPSGKRDRGNRDCQKNGIHLLTGRLYFVPGVETPP